MFLCFSVVDPHVTHYCLVVSSTANYSSLCEAQSEHYGNNIIFPNLKSQRGKRQKNVDRVGKMGKHINSKLWFVIDS